MVGIREVVSSSTSTNLPQLASPATQHKTLATHNGKNRQVAVGRARSTPHDEAAHVPAPALIAPVKIRNRSRLRIWNSPCKSRTSKPRNWRPPRKSLTRAETAHQRTTMRVPSPICVLEVVLSSYRRTPTAPACSLVGTLSLPPKAGPLTSRQRARARSNMSDANLSLSRMRRYQSSSSMSPYSPRTRTHLRPDDAALPLHQTRQTTSHHSRLVLLPTYRNASLS